MPQPKTVHIDEINQIKRLKEGCTRTFQAIYTQYNAPVFSYLRKKMQSEENAKEVMQLTFIKFWRYNSHLSLEISLATQLFRITRTCLIDFLREKAHERAIKASLSNEVNDQTNSELPPLSRLAYADLIKQLDNLPPIRKKVFYLSKVEGYSNKEIATQMHISVKTVEDHMTKALKKLRSSIVFPILLIISQF
ncbi:sigma-70 family RNA polymerase sigma factor [Olivibacter sp. CPCC 100613]|uniref:RNA polymerase sigma factor n=1 Tax=Olivibacter sp. CPCC 100613 TaxID=3079931 RepID=UPI002FFA9B62